MTHKQHIIVGCKILRQYTARYIRRRRNDANDQYYITTCADHGIKIDTNEHNRKLTITIELLCE